MRLCANGNGKIKESSTTSYEAAFEVSINNFGYYWLYVFIGTLR